MVVSPIATTPTFSEGGVKRKVVENGGGVGAASAKEETSLQGSMLSRLACCSVERRGSPFVFGMKKMIDLTYLASSIGEAFFFFRTLFPSPRSKGKPTSHTKNSTTGGGAGPKPHSHHLLSSQAMATLGGSWESWETWTGAFLLPAEKPRAPTTDHTMCCRM